jgi:ABC-type transport system involved in multi-copper enzyme maturation permease subunit
LCLLPLLITAIMMAVGLFVPGFIRDIKYFLGEMTVQIFFLLDVQLMALFFGSSIISEEVEDKTLTYLISRPVSRISIFLGKFSAYMAIPLMLMIAGLTVSLAVYFSIANFNIRFLGYVVFILQLWGVAFLHVLGYCGLFAFLGSIMRKPVIAGMVFVFGWENLVRLLPGVSRYLTLNFYLRPLLPSFNYSKHPQIMAFRISSPSVAESIIVVVGISAIFLIASMLIFRNKEIVLTDSV